MRRTRATANGFCVAAVLTLGVLPVGVAQAQQSEGTRTSLIGTEAQQKQWSEAVGLLCRGDIEKGHKLIAALTDSGVTDSRLGHVATWVQEYEVFEADRRSRIRDDYERYVAWAQEDLEAGRRHQAIIYTTRAFYLAEDQAAFREYAWVAKAAEGAIEKAKEYEQDHKWYGAARIHARLEEIFPNNKAYRQALERCQEHIRLELTYEPKADWEQSVAHITPDMAYDAFHKIATEYLKVPDFKAAAMGALQQVLLLAETPKLAEVFKGLEDEDNVAEFVSRVNVRMRYAQARDELTVQDLVAYFIRILEINEEVELFPQAVLIREFVYGALQPLDKFSDMIWPADVMEFKKTTEGRFSGVGIQIRKNAGEPILVVSPLRDSPAYAAGIRPGDLITRINGKSALKYTITRAVSEITGPVGSTVTLTIRRTGLNKESDREFDVELERQEILIHTIKGVERDETGDWKYMVDPDLGIAYVRLTNFTEGSYDELREVLDELAVKGLGGLILDLRDNPGGPLASAINVSDLFLPPGKPIVSTRDRDGTPWEVSSSEESPYANLPLLILASRSSASASEIVTGALQVHHRALVVGERTYGKGSVQQVLPLNHSQMAFLKLTTQHYYLPDGRCLHKEEDSTVWGVDPDVKEELVPKEFTKLKQLQLKRDVLKGKNQETLTEEDILSVTEYRPTTKPASHPEGEGEPGEVEGQEPPATQPTDVVEGEESLEEGEEEDEEEFVERDDPNDFPEVDPQLEMAVMLMRVRLESKQDWPRSAVEMAAKGSVNPGS